MSIERHRQVLKDPDSFGLTLSVSADKLTHGAHAAWDYDSLWVYLEDQGCLPKSVGREKLMATTAIRLNPAHLWDANVFQNLIAAFNGRISTPEIVDECSVGELVWGVVEAQKVLSHYSDEAATSPYGDEPAVYAAAVCANAGLVIIPPELNFCRDAVESMPKSGREDKLREEVLAKLAAEDEELDEDSASSVQAHILREVGEYVSTRKARLERDLASLT